LRVRNEGDTACANVDVLKEQILVVLGCEPVSQLEGARSESQNTAAEVGFTVVETASSGDIDVAGIVAGNASPSLPNAALTSGGGTLKDRQTLAEVTRIETLNETFLRPVLILRIGHDVCESNVQYLIPHQQADTLESAFDIGERLGSGKWERQELRR